MVKTCTMLCMQNLLQKRMPYIRTQVSYITCAQLNCCSYRLWAVPLLLKNPWGRTQIKWMCERDYKHDIRAEENLSESRELSLKQRWWRSLPVILDNCIMLYGRWVPGISRGLHCDQPAPRQYNAPMAGIACNPAMSPYVVFQAPFTLS